MPRIPTYQQQTTPSATLSVRTVDTGANDVVRGLAVVAGGTRQVGRSLKYVQEVETRKAEADDVTNVNLAATKGDAEWDQHFDERTRTHEGDPAGFTPQLLTDFDKWAGDLRGQAKTEKGRQLAEMSIAQMRGRLAGRAREWEAAKGIERRGRSYEESTDFAAKMARKYPDRYDELLEQAGKTLNEASLPADVRDKLWTATKQKLAASAVEALIEKNPWKAEAALRAEPGKSGIAAIEALPAELRERALDKAHGEKERRAEQGVASMLLANVRPMVAAMPIGPGDMIDLAAAKGQAVDAARKQFGSLTPEQILRIENYVESVARDREQEVRRGRAASLATVMDELDKNGGDMEALIAASPQALEGLDREGRERANNYAGQVALGGTRTTDWKSFSELIEDPQLLASVNLDSMRDRFNAREFAQLKGAQEKLLTDPTEEQNIRETGTLLKGMLKDAGVGKNDEESQARFYSLLQQAVDQELAATGKKKLPQTRVKELAEDLLVREVTSRGVIWDSKDEAFDIKVPETERLKIAAALNAEGLPASDYNILQAYRAKLRRQGQQ